MVSRAQIYGLVNNIYKISELRPTEKIANVYLRNSTIPLEKDQYSASNFEIKFAAGVLRFSKEFSIKIGKK